MSASYLYTWNPKRWTWSDYAYAVCQVNNKGEYDEEPWSCGNTTTKIKIGDIFFLMRLGEEPKGIIGCGYILSVPYEISHWNEKKAAAGKTANETDVLFVALSEQPDQPIVDLSELQEHYPEYDWTPQSGGRTVPKEIADELFMELQTNPITDFSPKTPDEVKLYAEGRIREVTSVTYDRSSKARQDCIEHYGYNCAVCGFNFKEKYGDIGEKYIEVHHLKPVSEAGEEYLINPVECLRPVCANCHRMLHRKKPVLSIEELKKYR